MSGKHPGAKKGIARSTDALIDVVHPNEGVSAGSAPLFEGHWLSSATNISLTNREAKHLCLGRPRQKLSAFLNHPIVSGILVALILLDVALVIAEVSLDAGKICKLPETPEAPMTEAPIIEAPIVEPNSSTPFLPPFEAAPLDHVEMCTLACNATVKPEFPSEGHEKAAHVLHYISLSILIFFAAEIFLSIVALGHLVFSRWIVLLDAVVISVSIVIDVVLHDSAGAIIVVVRLWRVARIVHGVFETIYEKLNDKIEEQKEKLKAKKEKIKALKLHVQSLEALAGGVNKGVASSPVERKKSRKKKREENDEE
eukprot:TRINITY_DN15833_c0_g1_i1.p1 TRINITY_DN15833_c0_g1~~TRINITY_DN15833_c0_g1_i1.p1  ORF type:complete len:312 (-),score=64.69 TRINITY_DN15833_c0_g1_i1:11-946(-)